MWIAVDVNDQTCDRSVCLLCLLPRGWSHKIGVLSSHVSMSEVGSTGSCLTFVYPFNFVCVEVHFKCSRPEDLYNKCDILCANTCMYFSLRDCVCIHACVYVYIMYVYIYVHMYMCVQYICMCCSIYQLTRELKSFDGW